MSSPISYLLTEASVPTAAVHRCVGLRGSLVHTSERPLIVRPTW